MVCLAVLGKLLFKGIDFGAEDVPAAVKYALCCNIDFVLEFNVGGF